ncbi:IucA/IucC family protein [Methylocystis iwaonis]|uniref:IucA/IucC family protein n=1 Tax=Methylocystis iwaonis TaxID=2885079 RepID=UPI002E7AF5CC|nr:IucA/IucC family protein [Methylocystis iwaonis]
MRQPLIASADPVLAELLELLWTEDIAGFRSRMLVEARDGRATACLRLGEHALSAELAWDAWREELRPVAVFERSSGDVLRTLNARDLLWIALSSLCDLDLAILDRTIRQLDDSVQTFEFLEKAAPRLENESKLAFAKGDNSIWEQLAAWRDRPFHPLARGRGGWGLDEIESYGAEFGRLFALRWCAAPRDRIRMSPAMERGEPADFILDSPQAEALTEKMARSGLAESHIALPVHPWHLDTAVGLEFAPELASGEIVALEFIGPLVSATSSLRTVAIAANPRRHIKLPLDVCTLGVRRLMSAQSLHNGLMGAALLEQACSRRPTIAARVRIADEARFWTFDEASHDIFAPRTAVLGCAIRDLPVSANDAALVPLASFSVAPCAGLPPAIEQALEIRPGTSVEGFLEELFQLVIGVAIEALHCGFMPEMHGQNVLIELVRGQPTRIVLRDHDTVRCLPEWLRRAGLQPPAYLIKDPGRATMLLERPESLIAYAQTLLFDVALRAICEAIDRSGRLELHASKRLLRRVTTREIETLEAPADIREQLRTAFLDEREWPFKQILTPLLATMQLGLGMPSAIGRAKNPLANPEKVV